MHACMFGGYASKSTVKVVDVGELPGGSKQWSWPLAGRDGEKNLDGYGPCDMDGTYICRSIVVIRDRTL